MTTINIGEKFKSCLIVAAEHFACSVGSGNLEVLSTPVMTSLMENAAMNCIASFLDESESSVGTALNIKHIAATPPGAVVNAVAEVIAVDGKRVDFKVEAFDDVEKIGEGTHTRFIISKEKFMNKVNSKLNA